jgi:tetratricopeptide (TPR) repeat protein
MPLKKFFTEQIDLLRHFLAEPRQTVRCVLVEADMRPILVKILTGLDRDERSPHLMLGCEVPFHNRRQFFAALQAELAGEVARWETQLRMMGLEITVKPEDFESLPPEESYVRYVAALAESFPDWFGALVVVLAPEQITDARGFRAAVEFLARYAPPLLVKFIVLDNRQNTALAGIDERLPRVWVQVFHLSPAEIEGRAKDDLAWGHGLSPQEKRQYTALLAGFAFARKEYDEALRLQQSWLELLGPDGPPAERASAYYNLGNTYLARKDHLAAEEVYGKALALALDGGLDSLVVMVLTNLGVTLYRQGRLDQALQSFRIARDTCKARSMRAVEAHVLDCLAKTYEADNQLHDAELCWREALAAYDSMTSPTFADARESGRADILDKLDRLAASGQRRKGA